jgi:hypothetical protein
VTLSSDDETIVAGDEVDVDVAIENTGNVALTGLTITPACPGAPTELAVDATAGVTCTIASPPGAVPPFGVVGSFAPTITVDSAEGRPQSTTLAPAIDVTIPHHTFSDGVPWADEAISWEAYHGIAVGYADGTFRPNAGITRGAFVRMVHRLAGSPLADYTGCGTDAFHDVPAWILDAVDWATCEGTPALMSGYPDGTFRASRPITRAQVVRTVWRFAGEPAATTPGCGTSAFSDVPGWVHDAVDWATCDPDGNGSNVAVMAGFPNGTFRPNAAITRAQVARLLLRTALLLHL